MNIDGITAEDINRLRDAINDFGKHCDILNPLEAETTSCRSCTFLKIKKKRPDLRCAGMSEEYLSRLLTDIMEEVNKNIDEQLLGDIC